MPKNWPPRPPITLETLAASAAGCRLLLSPQDAAPLKLQMQLVQALLDGLDAVELGETPPAIAYSAAWDK